MFEVKTITFIEVHTSDGKPVIIHIDNIGSVFPDHKTGCYISLKGESEPPSFHINESYEFVKEGMGLKGGGAEREEA